MVRREIEKAVAEERWYSATGLGILGLVGAVGLMPVLAAVLILAGVGLALMLYLLPITVACVVAYITYRLGKAIGLKGMRLFLAPVVSAVGAVVLFQFADFTLWSLGMGASLSGSVQAQATARGPLVGWVDNIINMLHLLLALLVLGFLFLGAVSIRELGGDPGALTAGVFSLLIAGIAISTAFDVRIPGLTAGTTAEPTHLPLVLLLLVGICVTGVAWMHERGR